MSISNWFSPTRWNLTKTDYKITAYLTIDKIINLCVCQMISSKSFNEREELSRAFLQFFVLLIAFKDDRD